MLIDSSQAKQYRIKTQHLQSAQQPSNQLQQPYINPIIKLTYDSLPKIYGSNIHRKKKYKISLKNKYQQTSLISKQRELKNNIINRYQNPKQQSGQQKRRGVSCLQFVKSQQKQIYERQLIAKTALKKRKDLRISTQVIQSHYQQTTKNKSPISNKSKKCTSFQSMHILSKPRQNCNKPYCSCKSLYQEYQKQVNKKRRQINQIASSRNSNAQKIKFQRMSVQLNKHMPSANIERLDDNQSRHKVNARYKVNSFEQKNQNFDEGCYLCNKSKQLNKKLQAKGLMGLIKKKQQQEKNAIQNHNHHKTQMQTIGTQIDQQLEPLTQSACENQNYGVQTNLPTPKQGMKKNHADLETQDREYKYLEKSKSKKQPLQHLSHLKQKYKYDKRKARSSKYCLNQNKEHDDSDHCNDQQTQNLIQKSNKKTALRRGKKATQREDQQQFDIATSSSILSQKSMTNHLVNALSSNGVDRSTIFKLLKKRQSQQSQGEQEASNKCKVHKKNKSGKKIKLVNQQNELFIIPEQEEYVDYLKSYQPIKKDFKIKALLKSDNFRILKYNDNLYFGEMSQNGVKHGQALSISPQEIFQGFYEKGIKMSGCQRNIDGVYIGEFVNGKRHGQGKFVWNNGQIFQGQWRLGTKNGHGYWKSLKGDYYQGQWLLNRQHGKGIYKHKNSIYEGSFDGFLKHGFGKQKFINGDQYQGQYSNGKPHGKGKYIWKNGSYYQGTFKQGIRQGQGKWSQNNNSYYEGQFKNDFKHGNGKQTYKNGDFYQGQFIEGIKTNGIFKQAASGRETIIKGSFEGNQQSKLSKRQLSQNTRQYNSKHKIKSGKLIPTQND